MTLLTIDDPMTATVITVAAMLIVVGCIIAIAVLTKAFRADMHKLEEENEQELRDWRDEGQNLPSKKK